MLLAIDTSGATAVAVIRDDGAVIADLSCDDPRGHAEHIGPMLAEAMAAVGGAAIDSVAYGVGPGPFTGLRVGMVAARAAAFALGAIELPVPSHDAIAFAALERGEALPFLVVAGAKRREVFSSAYRALDAAGVPVAEGGPRVGPEGELPEVRRVTGRVAGASLGRVALLRRAAGIPVPPGDALYLRSPDVTFATVRKSVLG